MAGDLDTWDAIIEQQDREAAQLEALNRAPAPAPAPAPTSAPRPAPRSFPSASAQLYSSGDRSGYTGPVARNRNVSADGRALNRTFSPQEPAAPAPAPAPPASSGGGSGGGGGGASIPAARLDMQFTSDLAGLDAQLEEERARLADQFDLAETDEEKDQLARTMAALERRYIEGRSMLENSYSRARAQVGDVADRVVGRRDEQMQGMMDALRAEAARLDEITSVAEGRDAGYGVGGTIGGTAGGDPYAAELADLAQIEGALSGQLNEVAQQDIAWVMNLLSAEEPAQQAALGRRVADREAAVNVDHNRRVQDRIGRERLALADMDQGLLGMFMDRRGDLEQMEFERQMFEAEMAQQAALARARSSGGGGSGGSGGSADAPGVMDPMTEALFAADIAGQYPEDRARQVMLAAGINPNDWFSDPDYSFRGPVAGSRNVDESGRARNRTYATEQG